MAERLNAPVLKTDDGKLSVSSNLTASASDSIFRASEYRNQLLDITEFGLLLNDCIQEGPRVVRIFLGDNQGKITG